MEFGSIFPNTETLPQTSWADINLVVIITELSISLVNRYDEIAATEDF